MRIASFFLSLVLAVAAPLHAQPAAPSRGELLYATHCVECHTQQVHWRDQRLAHDWNSLRAQVRRWQDAAGLQWTDEDIDAVARHLNDTFYKFPPAAAQARAAR